MQKLDYSALTSKVSFSQRLKAQSKSSNSSLIVFLVVLVAVAVFMFAGRSFGFFMLWPVVIVVVLLVAGLGVYRRAGRIVRMQRFADANKLNYTSDAAYDGRSGLIFNQGHSKKFLGIISSDQDDTWEIGNYQYTTGSGKHQSTHDYGFVRIQLPRRLPNMLLDAKENNWLGGRMSNLPSSLSGGQKMSLEGDFDKYFTLYAPLQYKRDALYVFTPDIMQALIDSVHSYDCEVVDDSFYIYSSDRLAIDNPQQLEEIMTIIGKLKPELVDQTDYYADERVGDRSLNVVARPGARLKTNAPTILIVIGILFALQLGWFLLSFVLRG